MQDKVQIEKKDGYILVTLSDTVITKSRALEILNLIAEKSATFDCNKVLLDERSVQSREVTSAEILKLSIHMAKKGLHKINIAFWCKSKLIDRDSNLLRLFTFTNEYMIQYFTERNEALAWLEVEDQG